MAEPVTLAELKSFLRLPILLDSDSIVESIPVAEYAARTTYNTVGAATIVSNKSATIAVTSGGLVTSSVLSVKIQESDSETTNFVDWFTFPNIITSNTVVDKLYTGSKKYIRTVGRNTVAAATYGTTISTQSALTDEDLTLQSYIETARQLAEQRTNRVFMTTAKTLVLEAFPSDPIYPYPTEYRPSGNGEIILPGGNLQTVESITYTDSVGLETVLEEDVDYIVELNGDKHGKILLAYDKSWPDFTPYPSRPIVIEYTCGYPNIDDVPASIKTYIKMLCADLYMSRGELIIGIGMTVFEPKTAERLRDLNVLYGAHHGN